MFRVFEENGLWFVQNCNTEEIVYCAATEDEAMAESYRLGIEAGTIKVADSTDDCEDSDNTRMNDAVIAMVKSANKYFENNRIKNESDTTFLVVEYMLHDAGCYAGFNYYKNKTIGDVTFKVIDPIGYEFLQFEIR